MNLTKYDIFFKVLETKTISQAAKDLGYSQSAVSQTIKSLEEELETTLFIRQKSGVILSVVSFLVKMDMHIFPI